jgi:transaldolase
MKIFIDSADIEEIKQAYDWGIADGVTTNPSLLRKALDERKDNELNLKIYIGEILKASKGTPVSLEVTSKKAKNMVLEGVMLYRNFKSYSKNVVIKIPVSPATKEDSKVHFEGIKAIKELSDRKLNVNATLVFTPEQALLAAKAGAKYVSVFVGRMDDYILEKNGLKASKEEYFPAEGIMKKEEILEDEGIFSGIDLLSQCVEIIKKHELKSEVLAASIRNKRQVREAALAGAHIATIPFNVLKDILKHEKTLEGMKKFSEDTPEEYKKITQ